MKILREDKALSYSGQDLQATNVTCKSCPENILVHGDNLEALKALLPFYAGKVKCIYIDPPYNTGSAFEHYDDNLEQPKLYFTSNGRGGIRRKTYLDSVGGVPPTTWWEFKDVGHTDEAKKEVLKLFDGQSPFATPKPERLIQRVLTIATNPGDLVMDSFLGSGTTAAVAQKMGRRWIGIEMKVTCTFARRKYTCRAQKSPKASPGNRLVICSYLGGGGGNFSKI